MRNQALCAVLKSKRRKREPPNFDRVESLSASRFRRREVVQPGGMPALGAGGRRFESCLPDQTKLLMVRFASLEEFNCNSVQNVTTLLKDSAKARLRLVYVTFMLRLCYVYGRRNKDIRQ